jgi:hypothetical protein
MSVERRYTTHHEGCHCHHHKETQRFKFSRHDSARQSCALLAEKINGKSRPKDWKIRGKAGGTVGRSATAETRRIFSPLDLLRLLDDSVFLGPVPKRGELDRRRFVRSLEMRAVLYQHFSKRHSVSPCAIRIGAAL